MDGSTSLASPASDWENYPMPTVDADFLSKLKELLQTEKIAIVQPLVKGLIMLLTKNMMLLSCEDGLEILDAFDINKGMFDRYKLESFTQILMYYMKTWPALQRISDLVEELDIISDQFNILYVDTENETTIDKRIRNWYKEYFAYLKLKMQQSIEILTSGKVVKDTQEMSTQTEDDNKNVFDHTPYALNVHAPPKFLNTIGFTTDGVNIIAKRHYFTSWNSQAMTTKKFINYPYVTVSLSLGNLSFSKGNFHEYERLITLNNNYIEDRYKNEAPIENKVINVNKLDETVEVIVYTKRYLKEYVQCFKDLLNKCNSVTAIRKSEIEDILDDFLLDIELISTEDAVATNVVTTFTIGNSKYFRRKYIDKINFFEIIKPKVQLTLKQFVAEQAFNNKNYGFKALLNYEKNLQDFEKLVNNSDTLSYSCNLCSKIFSTFYNVLAHFQSEHTKEDAVVCLKCNKAVEIIELAGNRWLHCS